MRRAIEARLWLGQQFASRQLPGMAGWPQWRRAPARRSACAESARPAVCARAAAGFLTAPYSRGLLAAHYRVRRPALGLLRWIRAVAGAAAGGLYLALSRTLPPQAAFIYLVEGSRSSLRRILPILDFGNSSRNSTYFGTL